MANSAQAFLRSWKNTYIDAEARGVAELDGTIAELVEDATQEGHSRADLEKAAGGDLRGYVRAAIVKASGE